LLAQGIEIPRVTSPRELLGIYRGIDNP
jgi:hypothetical protein